MGEKVYEDGNYVVLLYDSVDALIGYAAER